MISDAFSPFQSALSSLGNRVTNIESLASPIPKKINDIEKVNATQSGAINDLYSKDASLSGRIADLENRLSNQSSQINDLLNKVNVLSSQTPLPTGTPKPVPPAVIAAYQGASGGPSGNFVYLSISGPANLFLEDVSLGDVKYDILKCSTVNCSWLNDQQSVNIWGSDLYKGLNTNLTIKYRDVLNTHFQVVYTIQLQARADGFYNVIGFSNPQYSVL